MKIEKIVWVDSGYHKGEGGWIHITDAMRDWEVSKMEVITAGILAYEDSDVVGLSLSFSESTDAHVGLVLIHKESILSREVLSE